MKQNKKHSRKNNKRKKRNSQPNYKLGWVIVLIVFIPILYGLYLYNQQNCHSHSPQKEQQIVAEKIEIPPFPSVHELEIPVSRVPRTEQIIRHIGYTVSYNKDHRLPNWVAYELTREEIKGKEQRNNRFIADPLATGPIATNTDYVRSGYDKGHMAPAADMKWSKQAMEESFYFSNMCPQHPQLNRGGWKKLEDKIRNWAIADSAIIIICGPIVEKQPKTIGKNKVAVPQRFFKIVLSPFVQPIRAIGFLFDNAQSTLPLSSYVVTTDSIEQLTHLDFFAPLPDHIEKKIEAEADFSLWPQ